MLDLVWGKDGKLVRDYIGNTAYSACGTFLHDQDPSLAQGTMNTARTYWSNQVTNLTSDEPSEAWLYPATWGEWRFE